MRKDVEFEPVNFDGSGFPGLLKPQASARHAPYWRAPKTSLNKAVVRAAGSFRIFCSSCAST